MADKNKNKKLDPDELEETVDEEKVVSEAYTKEHTLTEEEVDKIDTFEELEEEAGEIEMKKKDEQIPEVEEVVVSEVEEGVEEEKEEEEEKPSSDVSIPEVGEEAKKEVKKEITGEIEKEVSKELKEGA